MSHPIWRGAAPWLGAVSFLLACVVSASAAEPPNLRLLTPPSVDSPTRVTIDLYDLQILSISEQDQVFRVGGRMLLQWVDPRQAFDAAAVGAGILEYQGATVEEQLENHVWWPDLEFVDGVGGRERQAVNLTLSAQGDVWYRERFEAEIKQDFYLDAFPFDEHYISFALEPFTYDGSVLQLVWAEDGRQPVSWEPSEWSVDDPEVEVSPGFGHVCETADGEVSEVFEGSCDEAAPCPGSTRCVAREGFSRVTVGMGIRREAGHYTGNVIVPLILILLTCTAVFFMSLDETHLGDRLGLAFTGLLTVVAFDFVASDSLPKLWYSTTLDRVITASYVFMAVCIALLVVADRWHEGNDGARRRAVTWTRWSRWLFPVAYLVVVGLLVMRAA